MRDKFFLDNHEQDILLMLARDSISTGIENIPIDKLQIQPTERLSLPLGVFVTIKIGKTLRGCIGSVFTDKPLWKSVAELARSSAFNDRRFTPLTKKEFDEIKIEISVLSEPERIKKLDEIEIGTHGIIVSSGFKRALFLPQVPVEQSWDLDAYISHCCFKAGLGMDFWKTHEVGIEIFTAFVFSE